MSKTHTLNEDRLSLLSRLINDYSVFRNQVDCDEELGFFKETVYRSLEGDQLEVAKLTFNEAGMPDLKIDLDYFIIDFGDDVD